MKTILILIIIICLFSGCDTLNHFRENDLKIKTPPCYYEFREGVVKHSNIDFKSELSECAVAFVADYLEYKYADNNDVKKFGVDAVEIDMNETDFIINGYFNGTFLESDDFLNRFLVVKYRIELKVTPDSETYYSLGDVDYSEQVEGHYWLVYDPENKYQYTCLDGYDWKIVSSDFREWNSRALSDKEIFDSMYNRSAYELPLHTELKENDRSVIGAIEQIKSDFESSLCNDSNILSYEILEIKANINATNWFINTLRYSDYTVSALLNNVICISARWTMKTADETEQNESMFMDGKFYSVSDEIIEQNIYLVYDCNHWEIIGFSNDGFNEFDNLSDEELINAINEM